MGLDAEKFSYSDGNIAASFTLAADGYVQIDRKQVTFEAITITKPWGADNPELTATVDEEALIGDDKIDYKVLRDPGETATTLVDEAVSSDDTTIAYNTYRTYVVIDEKDPDLENYEPVLTEGTLTIKKTPVEISSSIDGLEKVYSGTIVTLRAEMEGLDKYPDNYAYQWQISDEEKGPYVDIEKANEREYNYVLNKDTKDKHYRVVITLKLSNIK